MIASTERLMEIENVEDEPSNENRDRDELYSSMKGLSIQGIEFTYGRDVIFKKASFYVNKGDFVVISGASGIGKSTLIKLMLGVYPVNSGEICVDTNDGRVALDVSTRRLFAFVPQGNMIFSGTLRDNVAFIKRDASEEEIERALNISCSSGFISELPLGLDTVVGENGVGLSEGQVQRIAIARAILTKAPILLLDEATSALDEETEKQLLNNLSQLKDVTLIIISHKKSAFSICNRKIRIKDKKIVEE
jgi:ATP-binding cassette subfamily B protein